MTSFGELGIEETYVLNAGIQMLTEASVFILGFIKNSNKSA